MLGYLTHQQQAPNATAPIKIEFGSPSKRALSSGVMPDDKRSKIEPSSSDCVANEVPQYRLGVSGIADTDLAGSLKQLARLSADLKEYLTLATAKSTEIQNCLDSAEELLRKHSKAEPVVKTEERSSQIPTVPALVKTNAPIETVAKRPDLEIKIRLRMFRLDGRKIVTDTLQPMVYRDHSKQTVRRRPAHCSKESPEKPG